MRAAARALAWAVALGALLACATPPPSNIPSPGPGSRVHVVRRGENLWRISRWYGVELKQVAEVNHIVDPKKIRAGQRLWIPPKGLKAVSARGPARTPASIEPRGRAGSNHFIWPIQGKISSRYGKRKLAHHDGIDIAAPSGAPVRAAEAGRVVHSNNKLSGYGNLIIIKHAGSLATVYAHNHKNLVRVGQFVDKGEVIAEVGKTGRASAPHLHFEVRRNGKPENPLGYLP